MYTESDDRIMILNSTNGQSTTSVLIIDPVIPNDNGWYICIAFNDAGHSSQRIYVEVQCKVDASLYPHDIPECLHNFPLSFIHMFSVKPNLEPYSSSTPEQVILGGNATLQTLLVDANPMDITIRWLGPSGDLIPDSQYSGFNTSTGTVYTVNLITLTSSSGGVYICEVENSIGISIVNFTLLVIGEALLQLLFKYHLRIVKHFMSVLVLYAFTLHDRLDITITALNSFLGSTTYPPSH